MYRKSIFNFAVALPLTLIVSACMPIQGTHNTVKSVNSAHVLELTPAGEKVTLYPSAKLKRYNGCEHIITLTQVSNLKRDAALVELKNTVGLFGANSGTVNSYAETNQGTQYVISAYNCSKAPK